MMLTLLFFLIVSPDPAHAGRGYSFHIDHYIAGRQQEFGKSTVWRLETEAQGLSARLETLEGRIQSLANAKRSRTQQVSQLSALLKSTSLVIANPYESAPWLSQAEDQVRSFCCRLHLDPAFANAVFDNIQAGRRPTHGLKEQKPGK